MDQIEENPTFDEMPLQVKFTGIFSPEPPEPRPPCRLSPRHAQSVGWGAVWFPILAWEALTCNLVFNFILLSGSLWVVCPCIHMYFPVCVWQTASSFDISKCILHLTSFLANQLFLPSFPPSPPAIRPSSYPSPMLFSLSLFPISCYRIYF